MVFNIPRMANKKHHMDSVRPSYERKSKKKIVNYNDSNDKFIQRKSYQNLKKKFVKITKRKVKILASESVCHNSSSIPCHRKKKKPIDQMSLKIEAMQHNCDTDQPINRVKVTSALTKTADTVATLPCAKSCDEIKIKQEVHETDNVTGAGIDPDSEAIAFNDTDDKMMLTSSFENVPCHTCSSTEDKICKVEPMSNFCHTDNISECRNSFQIKEEMSESNDDNTSDVEQTRCVEIKSPLQSMHIDHGKEDQHECSKKHSVTIFAYKCQICQTGFATQHMMQKHNHTECSEIVKKKQRFQETDKNVQCQGSDFNIQCAFCPEKNVFENEHRYKHHLKYCHLMLPHDSKIRCALCGSKSIFDSFPQFENHLRKKHHFSKHYISRDDRQIQSTGEGVPYATNNCYVCRICDEPFSKLAPFLKHYDNHRLLSSKSSIFMKRREEEIIPHLDKVLDGTDPAAVLKFSSDGVHTEVENKISQTAVGIFTDDKSEGQFVPDCDLSSKKGLALKRKKKCYICPKCHKEYSRVIKYRRHIEKHGDISMTDSGIHLISDNLVYSIKISEHPKKQKEDRKCRICFICSRTLLTSSGYRRHMMRHGTGTFVQHQKASTSKVRGVRQIEGKVDSYICGSVPNVASNCDHSEKYQTDDNSIEQGITRDNLMVVENHTDMDVVHPPYDYCSSEVDDEREMHNAMRCPVVADSRIRPVFVISNAFSLSEDSPANVDFHTRMECMLAMEQVPGHSPKQDVDEQRCLSEECSTVDVCGTDDCKPFIESDEDIDVVGEHLEDSSRIIDPVNVSANENGDRKRQKVLKDTPHIVSISQMPRKTTVSYHDNCNNVSHGVHTKAKHKISKDVLGLFSNNEFKGQLDPDCDLSSTTEVKHVENTSASENSKISITIEGFEIEVDRPSDDGLFPSDCQDHNRQQVCKLENSNDIICKICHKSFTNYSKFFLHNKDCKQQPEINKERHASQRKKNKYTCPVCYKGYNISTKYRQHIEKHGVLSMSDSGLQLTSNDNFVYKIELIKNSIKQKDNSDPKKRKRNLQTKTKEKSTYRFCFFCSKTLLTFSGYRRHMMHHGIKLDKKCYAMQRQEASTFKLGHSMPKVASKCDNSETCQSDVDCIANSVTPDSLMVVKNHPNVDVVDSPYDDCSSEVDNESEMRNTACNGTVVAASRMQPDFVISNAFSLSDKSSANVDLQTRMECMRVMEQTPGHYPQEDVYKPHGLPEECSTVDVCGIDDCKPFMESDEDIDVVGDHLEDSSRTTDPVNMSKNENGGVSEVLTNISHISISQVPSKTTVSHDAVGEFNAKYEVNSTRELNLSCEICHKVLPSVVVKRIHMLLHKRS